MAPLLDRAADVRQKHANLKAMLDDMRSAGMEWVGYSIGAEEAMRIADDGLRSCWTMLDRLFHLAYNAKTEAEKRGSEG